MTQNFYYREVDESEVDPSFVREAMRVFAYCKKILNLPDDIFIQWVKETEKEGFELHNTLAKIEKNLCKLSGDRLSRVQTKYHKDHQNFYGQSYGMSRRENQITLRADMPFKEIGLTVAHECKHIEDFKRYRPPVTVSEKRCWEKKAEGFAQKAVKALEFKESLESLRDNLKDLFNSM